WEAEHRPALLGRWGGDAGAGAPPVPLTEEERAGLGAGPVLLFVHGTFSTAQGGFGALPAATLAELDRRYGGRVVAYQHPSVSVTPSDNVSALGDLLEEVPGPLTLDVVTHSRGGLVGRALAERASELGLGDRVTVRTLVMV